MSTAQLNLTFHEALVPELQPDRRFKAFALFTERIGQTGKPFHVQPRGGIQPLYVARGYQIEVGTPEYRFLFDRTDLGSAVSALCLYGFLGAVCLDDLTVIHIATEGPVDGIHVSPKA